MKRGYLVPAVAVVGLAIAVVVIVDNNRPIAKQPLAIQPSESPYDNYIAGVGIVEAASGNIKIGTPVSGVVTDVYVEVGDEVKSGDALFKIDDRDPKAALLTAEARADLAKKAVQKPEHRLEYLEKLRKNDADAVSVSELSDLRDDLAEAQAAHALARAQVEQIQSEIARHTIRAPADGEVLQLHRRLGEYAEAAQTLSPILIFGRDDRLYVRVDIDETVASRFQPGADAVGYLRGSPESGIPLQFEYTEPYVVPKQSLTGQSTERSDVRVLQVLYSLTNRELPVYVGQQLDVFIEANPESQQDRDTEQ